MKISLSLAPDSNPSSSFQGTEGNSLRIFKPSALVEYSNDAVAVDAYGQTASSNTLLEVHK
jgi:hypothetical protein